MRGLGLRDVDELERRVGARQVGDLDGAHGRAVTVQLDISLKTQIISTGESPIKEIVEFANHEEVDLIVVGTRGRSGIKKMLLGSTASGVVTYAHCPVLIGK